MRQEAGPTGGEGCCGQQQQQQLSLTGTDDAVICFPDGAAAAAGVPVVDYDYYRDAAEAWRMQEKEDNDEAKWEILTYADASFSSSSSMLSSSSTLSSSPSMMSSFSSPQREEHHHLHHLVAVVPPVGNIHNQKRRTVTFALPVIQKTVTYYAVEEEEEENYHDEDDDDDKNATVKSKKKIDFRYSEQARNTTVTALANHHHHRNNKNDDRTNHRLVYKSWKELRQRLDLVVDVRVAAALLCMVAAVALLKAFLFSVHFLLATTTNTTLRLSDSSSLFGWWCSLSVLCCALCLAFCTVVYLSILLLV